eukprot:3934433-Rhodomonas_salina.1
MAPRGTLSYTPESNKRNRIPATNSAENAVSCHGFRGVVSWALKLALTHWQAITHSHMCLPPLFQRCLKGLTPRKQKQVTAFLCSGVLKPPISNPLQVSRPCC